MIGARSAIFGILLAFAVAVLDRGLVRLVEASGARDEPAVILVLLLSAFLGLLTAVVVRGVDLPGAMAPTTLVLGWVVVPPIFGLIPATDAFAGDAALAATDAVALVVAVVAATVTLAVSGAWD
ncbi:MAG TPA: hypothetical protein VFH63_11350 [candidate division Zixibacteria bacterium]|nr:hypothetical protein [candidate division Zixibacteria bacterium]